MIFPPGDVTMLGSGKRGVDQSDPWAVASLDIERRDSWLLSYIDILMLLLTMLAMLLALSPNEGVSAAQDPSPTQPVVETVSLEGPVPVEALAADDAEPEPSYPIQVPWRDIALSSEDPGLFFDRSLFVRSLEDESRRAQGRALPESTEQERLPEGTQTGEPGAQGTAAPVDEMMRTLAAAGLSERLQAKKVAGGVHLQVNDKILFAPGSTALKTEGQALLDELLGMFGSHDCNIAVEGHTDSRPIANGRFPSNWELSAGRATMVARYLIDRGYDPGRLRATGYADTRPLAANDSPQGRARNRRVSVIVQFPGRKGTIEPHP